MRQTLWQAEVQSEKPFMAHAAELESAHSNKHIIIHLRQRLVETEPGL